MHCFTWHPPAAPLPPNHLLVRLANGFQGVAWQLLNIRAAGEEALGQCIKLTHLGVRHVVVADAAAPAVCGGEGRDEER